MHAGNAIRAHLNHRNPLHDSEKTIYSDVSEKERQCEKHFLNKNKKNALYIAHKKGRRVQKEKQAFKYKKKNNNFSRELRKKMIPHCVWHSYIPTYIL